MAPPWLPGSDLSAAVGEPPELNHLDNAGNLVFTTDFRSVYATILEGWLGAPAQANLGGDFSSQAFIQAVS